MDLTVKTRENLGKGNSALRKEGFIPAELYGRGFENAHIAINKKDFQKAFEEAGESTIINLVIGSDKRPALVHDIQKDFLTDEIIHIDFHQVRMDEKIKAHVPLEFIGEAPAIKEYAGVLNKTISEIEVEALPGNLPRHFEVDISSLKELNQSFYVSDLKVPKGVEIMVEPDTVIATVTPPAEEEKVEEAPVDVTAVKVESEEKAAERAKEKESTEEKK
ncbi:MAG TPA: 50S ribosomal protein L25 [Candidatus Paceibacterota bacterium]|nr:50S ribosomal protein L25 [Candidatus Paceibacterota bacterium]